MIELKMPRPSIINGKLVSGGGIISFTFLQVKNEIRASGIPRIKLK